MLNRPWCLLCRYYRTSYSKFEFDTNQRESEHGNATTALMQRMHYHHGLTKGENTLHVRYPPSTFDIAFSVLTAAFDATRLISHACSSAPLDATRSEATGLSSADCRISHFPP